jgi:hypothetical protein
MSLPGVRFRASAAGIKIKSCVGSIIIRAT